MHFTLYLSLLPIMALVSSQPARLREYMHFTYFLSLLLIMGLVKHLAHVWRTLRHLLDLAVLALAAFALVAHGS
jgi:hypothetical protein